MELCRIEIRISFLEAWEVAGEPRAAYDPREVLVKRFTCGALLGFQVRVLKLKRYALWRAHVGNVLLALVIMPDHLLPVGLEVVLPGAMPFGSVSHQVSQTRLPRCAQ